MSGTVALNLFRNWHCAFLLMGSGDGGSLLGLLAKTLGLAEEVLEAWELGWWGYTLADSICDCELCTVTVGVVSPALPSWNLTLFTGGPSPS